MNEEEKLSLENKGFEFDNIQEFKKALEMYNEMGFYDPDYEPEPEEDEDYEG